MLAALAVLTAALMPADDAVPAELLTVAERSEFRATARHAEVVALVDRLVDLSPYASRATLGTSFEGRELPLLVLSDPPVSTADEVRALADAEGRAIVFAFANIHAGEVCGKEALPMLARDVLLAPDAPEHRALLEELVVVFAPIYNADGNERFGLDNRPNQDGPAEGMGIRRNAQDLDLNRDAMKLEAPESRAMAAFLDAWDPHLVLDLHTTNGSLHRYHLTYAPPLNPAGPRGPIEYVRDELLPRVSRDVEVRHGWRTFLYGNFEDDHRVWGTYSALPRFGAQYHGLRGHLSILSEAYSHAPYRERVLATRDFVRTVLLDVAARADRVRGLVADGRAEVVAAGRRGDGSDAVGVRFARVASEQPATILGWEEAVDGRGRAYSTGVPRAYTVIHEDRFAPTHVVGRPRAYLIDPTEADVVELLRRHGVRVEPGAALADLGDVAIERTTITGVERSRDPYLGHEVIDLTTRIEPVDAPASLDAWHLVDMAQPLGTLALYLLEASSDDGLAACGMVDELLEPERAWPVLRVLAR